MNLVLSGIIAGTMSESGKVGYIAPYPAADILSGLNAFAMGARMVNPRIEVYIKWAVNSNIIAETEEITRELASTGTDIISHHNTLINRKFAKEYGVYTIKRNDAGQYLPDKYLAVPIWNWGIFYEKYIRSILAGGTRLGIDNAATGRVRNFWWGLDSGLLDFFYAKSHVPAATGRMVEFFKASIISQNYNVFTGPIYDNSGNLVVESGEELERERILSMNWLVEGIVGQIPQNYKNRPTSDLSTGKIV